MSSNHANTDSANGRSAFVTSSTDFALPFGSSRPIAASNPTHAAGSSSAGFFQTASSSVPISIPASPSPSLNFAQAGSSQHAPLLSLSGALGSSPSKLAASGAGLGIGNLPSPSARDQTNPLGQSHSASMFNNGQPQSPTLSLAGEGWPISPFTAFPSGPSSSSSAGAATTPSGLLRRAPGMNSPGFAIASPARFRRASMLGREITPFHLDKDDRSDEEDRSHDTATAHQTASGRRTSNQDPDDGDDEMMQVEDDDALASRAPSTPVMGPPLSFFSTPSTPPPTSVSHHHTSRPSLASSALARASASDSGQESSSSGGGGAALSRTVPRSPSAGPSMGSPLGHGGNRSRSSSLLSSNVVRKAVTRRGNLLPKDRSMARVAASLQDESKPEDSEIASEAKLQKRLGGDAILPRTPRFGPSAGGSSHSVGTAGSSNHGSMRMSKSPFFGATSGPNAGSSRRKYMWDDDVDDIRGVFVADGLDDGESSDISSEEEEMMMYYSRNGSLSDEENEMRSRGFEASSIMQDVVPSSGISADTAGVNDASNSGDGAGNSAALSTSIGSTSAAPSTGVGSLPKRKNNALWMGFRDKGNAHKWSPSASGSTSGAGNGVFTGERAAWRRAGGSSAMDLDTSPRVLGAAGGARLSKRKTMGDDRYEPYKRRAVSPMNLGSSLGTTPANISLAAAAVAASQPGGGSGGGGGSPLLMPISSPSGILHPRIHQHFSAYAARYSTSPTISRPITPVNANPGGPPAMGAFSPAAGAGSGPGYGSGALGLSISANNTQSMESRMMEERQEENEALMDEKVGLMGLS